MALLGSGIVDSPQSRFSLRIVRPTAPRPVFRMFHQLPLHRIRMHILDLFFHLFCAPYIEVVKSPLPETAVVQFTSRKLQQELSGFPLSPLPAQCPPYFLLQHLQAPPTLPARR